MTQSHDRILELLKSLGLSEDQSSIYIELLDKPQGENLDKVLSSYGISSQQAETAVKELVERGLLSVVSNRVEAMEPKVFLEKVIQDRRSDFERSMLRATSIADELLKSLEPLYWEGRLGIRPEEIIQPLTDLTEMELRTTKVIGNAGKEIFVFAQTFGWYEKIREALFQALDRGVRARVLMMVVDAQTKRRADELRSFGVEVRHCVEEWYPVRGTLVDDQELVFLIWATRKKEMPKPVYYRPHYTKNQGLIRIFADAFHKRWEEGKPI